MKPKTSNIDKIAQMYNEFDFGNNNNTPKQKSSFGIGVSDEKLKLYDIMQMKQKKLAQKPKDIYTKLRQVKRDYLNYEYTPANQLFPYSKVKPVDQNLPLGFKQKYYELARLSGNDLNEKKEKKINTYTIFNKNKPSGQIERKSDILKKQILIEIAGDRGVRRPVSPNPFGIRSLNI